MCSELDRVPDEEDLEVVAHHVPVAVLGTELHRETARVTRRLGGVPAADDGGEPDGHRGLLALGDEGLRAGVLRGRLVADRAVRLELAVRDEATGVHDALGHALAVEVADLLDELVVLERRRAAAAHGPHLLVVPDRVALPGGEHGLVAHKWSIPSRFLL
jgi:hypothetical protein